MALFPKEAAPLRGIQKPRPTFSKYAFLNSHGCESLWELMYADILEHAFLNYRGCESLWV